MKLSDGCFLQVFCPPPFPTTAHDLPSASCFTQHLCRARNFLIRGTGKLLLLPRCRINPCVLSCSLSSRFSNSIPSKRNMINLDSLIRRHAFQTHCNVGIQEGCQGLSIHQSRRDDCRQYLYAVDRYVPQQEPRTPHLIQRNCCLRPYSSRDTCLARLACSSANTTFSLEDASLQYNSSSLSNLVLPYLPSIFCQDTCKRASRLMIHRAGDILQCLYFVEHPE